MHFVLPLNPAALAQDRRAFASVAAGGIRPRCRIGGKLAIEQRRGRFGGERRRPVEEYESDGKTRGEGGGESNDRTPG
jgi:hypothetical protein